MNSKPTTRAQIIPAWLNGTNGIIAIIALVYLLFYFAWLQFGWGGEDYVILLGDLLPLPLDLLAAIFAWRVVLIQKESDAELRKTWVFLSLGLSSFLLADLIWAYIEIILQSDAFPSLADVFYLLFPFFMAIGLFTMPGATLNIQERRRLILDIVIVLLTFIMSMWYFIIQPTAVSSAGDWLSQMVSVAYPVGDVIIVFGIISSMLRKPDRDSQEVLVYFFLGVLFFVGADIVFSYTSLAGTYTSGTWLDAGWYAGIVMFLFAALRQGYRSSTESQLLPPSERVEQFFLGFPLVSVIVGSLLTFAIIILNFDLLAGWLIAGAILSIILFVIRQTLGSSLQTKFILAFTLTTFLVASSTSLIYYNYLRNQSLQSFRSLAINAANIAALQQDGDELIRISSEEDPLYEKYRVQNLKIRSTDPRFVFVYTMRKNENGIYFVVDAGEPGEEGIATFGELYDDASSTLVENFDTMVTAIADSEIYTDKFGSFLSAYAPIFTRDGTRVGAIGVDINASTIVENQKRILTQAILVIVLVSLLGLVFGYNVGNLLTKPIKQLTSETEQFTEGNLLFRTNIATNDEVGMLGRAFNRMVEQIQLLVTGLEQRVEERTSELELANRESTRRARQFEAIAQVARTISSTRDIEALLVQIPEVLHREFGFYHAGIFLLDTAREYAVLSGTNSEGGRRMLARGHRLKVGETGMVGYTTSTGRPRVALDTGKDAVFINSPDLPETRSELTLPLMAGNEVIGALDVQSTEANAFDQEDIRNLGTLADQVSIAIQNARQNEETRRALNEAETLSRQFVQTGWSRFTQREKLKGIRHTGAKTTLLYEHNGINGEPSNLEEDAFKSKKRDGTILSLPVRLRGEIIGAVNVHSTENRQWDQDELDIVNAIIERSAIAMENARLLTESQKQANKERTIGEISARISAQNEIDELLKTAVQELSRNLPGMRVAVQLNNDTLD